MELLREGAKALGLMLGPAHLAAFELYYRELAAWNQRFNLTTVTAYEEVQCRHFLDSLSCLLALPQEAEGVAPPAEQAPLIPDSVPLQRHARALWCLDVGSGAGFPGLPLKMMLPEIKLTLIEATGKKATFLRHIVEVLGLENVEVLNARAEEVGQLPAHREHYDLVLARAVAHLSVVAEYGLPFCHLGGRMVAQKGADAAAEAEAAQGAFRILGGTLRSVKPIALPGLTGERYLVVVDKTAPTPAAYPRRPGLPAKKPLIL